MDRLETQKVKYSELNSSVFQQLEQGACHFWRVSLHPSQEILDACYNALSAREKSRLDFFEFANVKQNYLVSQGMMRILLANYLTIEPEDVQIGRHEKGKPLSLDDPYLFFNNSNSGSYCVYAFSRMGEVGIDLEENSQLSDLEELIEKNLTPKEKERIQKNQDQKQTNFYRYWTLKEAYLKAIGEGMRIEPHRLEFDLGKEVRFNGMNGYVDQEVWEIKEVPFDNYLRVLVYSGDANPNVQDFEVV